jgi:hypothetical protein
VYVTRPCKTTIVCVESDGRERDIEHEQHPCDEMFPAFCVVDIVRLITIVYDGIEMFRI